MKPTATLAPPVTATAHVLHLITRMVHGGAQENTLATVAAIAGGGWRSTLVTGPADGPEGSLEPECHRRGVRMIHVPELVRELSPAQDVRALRRLVALIRAEQPQIVHTHTSKAGILGRIAARMARVPVVIHTPHGHVFHGYYGPLRSQLFRWIEWACAPLADRLIALTEQERQDHLRRGIGRPERFVVIPSGVDFAPIDAARTQRRATRAALGIAPDAPVIGCVARLVPIKDHATLLAAFQRVAAAVPRAVLLLVGDGPLRGDLEARATALGIGDRVRFLGLRTDVPRLLAAMDLFALASLNEGMGRVLVEAMAMGLPVVATRVAGIVDVVRDGESGLLVPPQDPEGMAAAIVALLRDPGLRRQMGEAGRRGVVPGYSVETMVARLRALYRETLAERGLPVPPS